MVVLTVFGKTRRGGGNVRGCGESCGRAIRNASRDGIFIEECPVASAAEFRNTRFENHEEGEVAAALLPR